MEKNRQILIGTIVCLITFVMPLSVTVTAETLPLDWDDISDSITMTSSQTSPAKAGGIPHGTMV